jgi:hypothetical protein
MGKVCQSIPSGSEDKDVPWQKAWRSDHGAGNPVNRDDIKGGVKTKNNNLPAIIPYNPPFLPHHYAAERGIPINLFSLDFSLSGLSQMGLIDHLAQSDILRQCCLCERIAKRLMADLISNNPALFKCRNPSKKYSQLVGLVDMK